jgi:hypothetical protein
VNFTIVNPHDPYVMTAPDLKVAAVAIALLGEGRYGLKGIGESTGEDVPTFLLGGHDRWYLDAFGTTFERALDSVICDRADELAAALNSVTLDAGAASSLVDLKAMARTMADNVRRVMSARAATTAAQVPA